MKVFPFITVLTAVPLVMALAILIIGDRRREVVRGMAFTSSFVTLVLALMLWCQFDLASGQLQFQELHAWIPSIGVEYHVGVDGLGIVMVLLSAILVPMSIAASSVHEREGLYLSLILFLQAGLFGTFTALNFFHWFVFWELSLIPAFFLIRLWGGPRRASASTQFFVYTMVGSIALLLGFLAVFVYTGVVDFARLSDVGKSGELISALANRPGAHRFSPEHVALAIFSGIFLGFAIKTPLIPFHTWLPSTYAEAPTEVTMLLTGAMSKMGLYGFLRILVPLFSAEMRAVSTLLLWMALATIVLSALSALAQKDLKRILAYSSINHLGYCALGIFAVARSSSNDAFVTDRGAALDGAILQMFNHGLTAATLFWFVAMLQKRSGGVHGLDSFGGLRRVIPVFCGVMGIALFSSLGLPGLNGFIGEFLIFRGTFPLAAWAAALATIGLLVTAIFILTILQRVFMGPLNQRWGAMSDLSLRERIALSVPIALMFTLGIDPQLMLSHINGTVMKMVQQVRY
jgi:NADH-quinone oxidoreductase subunit M